MVLFVKHYKQEVLGVGEVALPGEAEALREAARQRTAKDHDDDGGDKKDARGDHGATNGTDDSPEAQYVSYVQRWPLYSPLT